MHQRPGNEDHRSCSPHNDICGNQGESPCIGMFHVLADGTITKASPNLLRGLRLTESALGREKWFAGMNDRNRLSNEWLQKTSTGAEVITFNLATESNTPDAHAPGGQLTFQNSMESGNPTYPLGCLIRHQQASAASQTDAISRMLTRLAFSNTPPSWSAWTWDVQSGVLTLDPNWPTLFQYSQETVPTHFDQWIDLIAKEDLPRLLAAIDRCCVGAANRIEVRYRFRHGDGRFRWVAAFGLVTAFDREGKPSMMVGFEYEESQAWLRQVFLVSGLNLLDHVQESIIATDLRGNIWYWGKGAERLYGWRSDEVLGRSIMLLVPAVDQIDEAARLKAVCETGKWNGSSIQRKRDGTTFTSETYIALIRSAEGEPAGFVGIDHDVSQRETAKERIAQLQLQLTEVSGSSVKAEILAGISHEVNQPLFAIQNYLTAARVMFRRNLLEKGNGLLDRIDEQISRAHEISTTMLNFATSRKLTLSAQDFNSVYDGCRPLIVLYTEKSNSTIIFDACAQRSRILCDELQLQQVILNIVRNSCDAISGCASCSKGIVRVTTRNDANYLIVEFVDNGPGMTAESLSRVFNQIYTTKTHGTGVGLSLCRTIVQAHHGEISISSPAGGGTKVAIRLPLFTGTAKEPN